MRSFIFVMIKTALSFIFSINGSKQRHVNDFVLKRGSCTLQMSKFLTDRILNMLVKGITDERHYPVITRKLPASASQPCYWKNGKLDKTLLHRLSRLCKCLRFQQARLWQLFMAMPPIVLAAIFARKAWLEICSLCRPHLIFDGQLMN